MNRRKRLLLKVNPAVRALVVAAAREAFSTAEICEAAGIEVTDSEAPQADLVVLAEPDEALAERCASATDAAGRPRCAVVILGRGRFDRVETVPPEEWNRRSLVHAFRAAVALHELRRENLQLRGDLMTVARCISHDLRTPVGCIHMGCELLSERSIRAGVSLPDVAEIFCQSAGEISQLIERVSFVLRASAEPPASSVVAMGPVVAAAVLQLEAEIRAAEAELTQPDAWPEAEGVPAWLQVIWWNFLHNAIRHGGHSVRVRLSWIPEDGGYRFAVADSGPGVEPFREAGLFSPFERLHGLHAAGLGLSIVERLVALQGGTCSYHREPEVGTCFSFTLPAAGGFPRNNHARGGAGPA